MRRAKLPRPRREGWRHRENSAAWFMLLPAFLPYAAFALVPIAWLIYYSFHRWNGFTEPTFVGLDNYARVGRDSQWWESVVTTLQFTGGRLVLEVPLALALAYVFFRGVRGGTILRTIYFLPYVLSPAIIGIVFGFLLRHIGGPFNQVLLATSLVDSPVNFLGDATNALLSLIGVGVWAHVGINMLLFFAGMMTIPTELTESAAVEGAGEWQTFRHIVLPMLMPVARIVVLISIIGILRSFDLVKTLTDGGPARATDVMFTYIYRFFFEPTAIPQIGYAAALGVSASVVVGVVSVAYLRLVRRHEA
ncbi:sugar ABC transporter permease [Actinopolymorpha sp. B17G11]|uniref:carbohydrate ABC transporter permease n=1 Tax=Actinopolymorpha sp. B17G11 TaxID=3160861 RepID=UPI0032E49B5D